MKFFQFIASFLTGIFSFLFPSNKKAPTTPSTPKEQPKPHPSAPTTEKPAENTKPEPATPEPEPEPEVEVPDEFQLPSVENLNIERIGSGSAPDFIITNGTNKVKFEGAKKGFYTFGEQTVSNFLKSPYASKLESLNLSTSAINVIQSVSDNEGNLDAINTWDNSFLTFGMFQWSLGPKGDTGELPALLKKVKEQFPGVYHHYFGQFGLEISEVTTKVYGYFLLNDKRIDTVAEKEPFRTAGWGYRFWLSGQHPDIQAIQFEHAISRLKTFYWKKPNGWNNTIAEVVTSEYGVALILDNHVNRPGYVEKCLKRAWERAGLGENPKDWTTEEEEKLINEYISIRETYGSSPMTDAAKRARNTKRYLTNGIISKERFSFNYNPGAERSLEPINYDAIPEPYDYAEDQYENIRTFEENEEQA